MALQRAAIGMNAVRYVRRADEMACEAADLASRLKASHAEPQSKEAGK